VCKVLDHFDDEALPELIDNLHPRRRVGAGVGVACAGLRPLQRGRVPAGEEDVLPLAVRMLREDPSRRVRQMAAGMVGPGVHRSEAARRALEQAHAHDPHPVVRKLPDGTYRAHFAIAA
jgi:hypothetical protein